jgi:hypothetical protein
MDTLLVPGPVREKLGDEGSDGLLMMFAEAHRIATASFERRLAEEISRFRVEMVERMSDLKFDILKWNFLFWIGQLAAMTAILSIMLRDVR